MRSKYFPPGRVALTFWDWSSTDDAADAKLNGGLKGRRHERPDSPSSVLDRRSDGESAPFALDAAVKLAVGMRRAYCASRRNGNVQRLIHCSTPAASLGILEAQQEDDMTSRSEMRDAKRSAGICVEPTCGNKAQTPWEH